MKPNDFMFILNMQSGYHQVPLKPSVKTFCVFLEGQGLSMEGDALWPVFCNQSLHQAFQVPAGLLVGTGYPDVHLY